jgi:hypothetical protein
VKDVASDSAVVCWTSSAPMQTHLTLWGPAGVVFLHERRERCLHEVRISNLRPDTAYKYAVDISEVWGRSVGGGDIHTSHSELNRKAVKN